MDDDEEFPILPLPAHMKGKSSGGEDAKKTTTTEEDEDELDAFMAGIETKVDVFDIYISFSFSFSFCLFL